MIPVQELLIIPLNFTMHFNFTVILNIYTQRDFCGIQVDENIWMILNGFASLM